MAIKRVLTLEVGVQGAFGELIAEAQRAADAIEKAFERSALAASKALNQIGEHAFDDLDNEAKVAGERIVDTMVDTAVASDRALSQIGERAFDDIDNEARLAGERIVQAFRAAAQAADAALDTSIEIDTARLTAEARLAGLSVAQSLAQGAAEGRAALGQIDAGDPFAGLVRDAETAAARITAVFVEASAAIRVALERAGGDAFTTIAVEAEASATLVAETFTAAASVAERAFELIGGDAFVKVALEAQGAAAAITADFAAIPDIDVDIDTSHIAAEAARARALLTAQLRDVKVDLNLNLGKVAAQAAASRSALAKAGADAGTHFGGGILRSLGRTLVTASIFAAGAGAAAFAAFGTIISAQFERITVATRNILDVRVPADFLGGGEERIAAIGRAAGSLERQLERLALRTPFGFADLNAVAQQLLAIGRPIEAITRDAESLGAAVAFFGGTSDDLQPLIRAIGQISGSTHVMGQDLNQITQRLPGFNARMELAFAIGADQALRAAGATGDLTVEIGKLREAGLQTPKALGFINVGLERLVKNLTLGPEAAVLLIGSLRNIPGALQGLRREAASLTGQLERITEAAQLAVRDGFKPLALFLSGGILGGGFLDQAIPTITRAVAEIGAAVADAGLQIGPSLLNLFDSLAPSLAALIRNIATFLTPIIDAFSGFLDRNGDLIADSFERIARSLGQVSAVGLVGVLDALVALLPLIEAAGRLLELIPDQVLEIAVAGLTLAKIFTSISKAFAGLAIAKTVAELGGLRLAFLALAESIGVAILAVPGLAALAAALAAVTAVGFAIFRNRQQDHAAAVEFRRDVQDLAAALQEVDAAGLDAADTLAAVQSQLTGFFETEIGERSQAVQDALDAAGISAAKLAEIVAEGGNVDDVLLRVAKNVSTAGGIIDKGTTGAIEAIRELLDLPHQAVNEALAAALGGGEITFADFFGIVGLPDDVERATQLAVAKANKALADIDALGIAGAIRAGIVDSKVLQAAVDQVRDALFTTPTDLLLGAVELGGLGVAVEDLAALSAQFVATDGNVEKLIDGLIDAGVSVEDLGTGISAVLADVGARVEDLNRIIGALDFGGLLTSTEEFRKQLRGAFEGEGESAAEAFLANFELAASAQIGRSQRAAALLAAPITKGLEDARRFLVEGLVAQGDEGARVLESIFNAGSIELSARRIQAQIDELAAQFGEGFRAALLAGEFTLADLFDTDAVEAKLDALNVKVAATFAELQRIARSQLEVDIPVGGPGRAFAGREAEERAAFGAGGTISGATDAEFAQSVQAAKSAGAEVGTAFHESVTTSATAGLAGVGAAIGADLAAAFTLAVGIGKLTLLNLGDGLAKVSQQVGVDTGEALGTGFEESVAPAVEEAFGTLTATVVEEGTAIGQEAGQAIATGMSDGLVSSYFLVGIAVSVLIGNLRSQVVGGLVSVAFDAFNGGLNIGTNVGDGIQASIGGSIAGARQAIINALSGLADSLRSQGRSAGEAFSAGIAQGIRNGIPGIRAAANAAAAATRSGFQRPLKISSPSKVGIELGSNFTRGLAIGVGDTRPLTSALRSLTSTASGLQLGGASLGAASTALSVGAVSAPSFGSGVAEVKIVGGVSIDNVSEFPSPKGGETVVNVPIEVLGGNIDPGLLADQISHRAARRVSNGGFRTR